MPLYTYVCPQCGKEEEHIVSMDDRNNVSIPCACGAELQKGIDIPKLGTAPHKMQAVMTDGSHVDGHFGGKIAKNK